MNQKVLHLFIGCLFISTVSAQIPVFQVLYAEKASLSNGTPLKSLDKLLDETIHVADSGYLVLIHSTGIPVEWSGDTTITLSEIHTILNPPSKDKHLSTYQRSIGVEYLLIPQGVEARKFRLNRTGAYFNDALVHSVYPPLINGYVYFDDDVKVVWQRGFVGINLDVSVVNVFDEKLKSPIIDDSTVLINKQELIDQKTDCIITFATVTEKGKKKKKNYTGEGFFIKRFYTDKIDFPYSAKIKTPAAALMAGYFYELASWGVSKEAQAHYELATQLSDKQFYKDMLSNYLKRSGQ